KPRTPKVTRESVKEAVKANIDRAMKDPAGWAADLRKATPEERTKMLQLGGRRQHYERPYKEIFGEEAPKKYSMAEMARRMGREVSGEPETPTPRPAVKSAERAIKAAEPEAAKPPVKTTGGKKLPAKVAEPEAAKPPVKAAPVKAAQPAESVDILPRLREATPEQRQEMLDGLHPRLKGQYQALARGLDVPFNDKTTRKQLIDGIQKKLAGEEPEAPAVRRPAVKTAPPVKAA